MAKKTKNIELEVAENGFILKYTVCTEGEGNYGNILEVARKEEIYKFDEGENAIRRMLELKRKRPK